MTRDILITADASKVSPADFMDLIFGPGHMDAIRADVRAECMRAIERGDTYGFPPLMVAECRAMMADGVKAIGDGRFQVAA